MAAGFTADKAAAARNAEGKRERRVDAITAATRADLLRDLRLIKETNVNARRATPRACADTINRGMMLVTAQYWLNLAKAAELTERRDSNAKHSIA